MDPSPRQQFETALAQLVEKFARHQFDYMRSNYNEAQARIDFIDPLFEALGWDVRNTQGLSRRERAVIVESGQTEGRPDYNFRVQAQTQFFAEAKAPHVWLDEQRVVLQAKKYALNETSQTVLLVVVTNFIEFRLYEVRDISYLRRSSKGLVFAYHYEHYLSRKALDDLWRLSRPAIEAGSLDTLIAPAARLARQRMPLDQQFLADLTDWRTRLAKAIFKAQPELADSDLNRVVQVFLDRLIFIRVAEDRGGLPKDQLWDIARHWQEFRRSARPIMAELLPLFRVVNQTLNGEIFQPHDYENLKWDSALIADIIVEGLEPYNFAQIPIELLGSIYERYLSKTIRVTPTRAIIEDKPAVRKAGGVYYTPKYIVDYIVEQTVGQLIEGKTPKQIEPIKILDPACGSGSFLIGAYQKLLDYHTAYYTQRAKDASASNDQTHLLRDEGEAYGEFKLSLAQKAAILQNNIFGVDIDPQAVEITMMSLYIKLLEGERGLLSGRALLPRLNDNIKCGNSLVGYDLGAVSAEEKAYINPFDWHSVSEGFGAIMAAGGFDVVLGNPPYGAELSTDVVAYLSAHYKTAQYKFDSFVFFIEAGIRLLGKAGALGCIIPNTWFDTKTHSRLRKFILDNTAIQQIVNLGKGVFAANIDTALLFVRKLPTSGVVNIIDASHAAKQAERIALPRRSFSINQHEWAQDADFRFNVFVGTDEATLFQKIKARAVLLGEITESSQGLIPYNTKVLSAKNPYIGNKRAGKDWKPFLDKGTCISRYALEWNGLYVKFGNWLYTPNQPKFYENDKILIQRHRNPSLQRRIVATLDTARYYFKDNMCCLIAKSDSQYELRYILGVLNSALLNFFYKKNFTEVSLNPVYLRQLPIHAINFSDHADQVRHDKVVALTERLLTLHKQKQTVRSAVARTRLEHEINVTDEQLDALVYELYELTPEEIKLIESVAA